jgi:hypothetical protein
VAGRPSRGRAILRSKKFIIGGSRQSLLLRMFGRKESRVSSCGHWVLKGASRSFSPDDGLNRMSVADA